MEQISEVIPEAKIIRISGNAKGTKYYIIRCPYCENQHYHAIRGGLGNRGRHCLDFPFMKKRTQRIFLMNTKKYGDCRSYDIVN